MVIAAKSTEPQPTLPGSIYTVAAEVEALGVQAFPCVVDLRDESQWELGLGKGLQQLKAASYPESTDPADAVMRWSN